MGGDRSGRTGALSGLAVLLGLALALGGCGSNSAGGGLGGTDLLGSFSSTGTGNRASGASGDLASVAANDTPCPEMQIRSGASTLIVSSKPGEGTPNPLDVRYQGTIVRLARECRLNAGLLTIKVGVEGRIATGPAGTPGTVNVPLRIAVVEDAVRPKTIVSRVAKIPVTVNSSVDRVTFTHVDPDVRFPAPNPVSRVDRYVIYVGFDPLGGQQQKAPTRKRRATSRARS
jgi:hypothetical protein